MACYHNNSLILNEGTDENYKCRTFAANTRPSSSSRHVYKIVNIFHDFGDAIHTQTSNKNYANLYHDFITTDNNF